MSSQGHTANKYWSQISNPGCLPPESTQLSNSLYKFNTWEFWERHETKRKRIHRQTNRGLYMVKVHGVKRKRVNLKSYRQRKTIRVYSFEAMGSPRSWLVQGEPWTGLLERMVLEIKSEVTWWISHVTIEFPLKQILDLNLVQNEGE